MYKWVTYGSYLDYCVGQVGKKSDSLLSPVAIIVLYNT